MALDHLAMAMALDHLAMAMALDHLAMVTAAASSSAELPSTIAAVHVHMPAQRLRGAEVPAAEVAAVSSLLLLLLLQRRRR
jgi:hypothetical protein